MPKITALILVIFLMVPMAAASPAVQIEGVSFSQSRRVKDANLSLQGIGLLRYMIFIKAYVGALYLAPSAGSGDVLLPVAKRLELQYFQAIKKEEFATATRIKIADNVSVQQAERLKPRVDQLAAMYQDVRPGDRYALTFIPGEGTELALNGKSLGTVPGSDFASALFAVWFGADPIDADFRDTLLGGA